MLANTEIWFSAEQMSVKTSFGGAEWEITYSCQSVADRPDALDGKCDLSSGARNGK